MLDHRAKTTRAKPTNPRGVDVRGLGIARTCAFFLGGDYSGASWIILRNGPRSKPKKAKGMDVRATA
eukprot:1237319-Pyramimonas_sp.AAC.1